MTADASSEPETRNPEPATYLGEFTTHSAAETFALARGIGEQLKGGEVFLLEGELGAGKTVFAKGLAAGLGIDPADVTSPTFTLINVHDGRLRFYHIDLYRLDAGGHERLGLEESFEDETAVTAVEWAERLSHAISDAILVAVQQVSENVRRISVRRLG